MQPLTTHKNVDFTIFGSINEHTKIVNCKRLRKNGLIYYNNNLKIFRHTHTHREDECFVYAQNIHLLINSEHSVERKEITKKQKTRLN